MIFKSRKLPVICRGSAHTHEDPRARARRAKVILSPHRFARRWNFARQIRRPGPCPRICTYTMDENQWFPSVDPPKPPPLANFRPLRPFHPCHNPPLWLSWARLGCVRVSSRLRLLIFACLNNINEKIMFFIGFLKGNIWGFLSFFRDQFNSICSWCGLRLVWVELQS